MSLHIIGYFQEMVMLPTYLKYKTSNKLINVLLFIPYVIFLLVSLLFLIFMLIVLSPILFIYTIISVLLNKEENKFILYKVILMTFYANRRKHQSNEEIKK